jgi:hypothetical protein
MARTKKIKIKKPKIRITVDKVPRTKQYRVQITENEDFLGRRTFNLRKDAEEYKKRLKQRYKR